LRYQFVTLVATAGNANAAGVYSAATVATLATTTSRSAAICRGSRRFAPPRCRRRGPRCCSSLPTPHAAGQPGHSSNRRSVETELARRFDTLPFHM